MITNGYRSYAVFTYNCGQLEWSGDAIIGFKADNDLYGTHPLSGQDASSIACENEPEAAWNNVVYQLSKFTYVLSYMRNTQ